MTPIEIAHKAAEEGARQNDRYLFLLLLAVVFAVIFVAGKWLVGQIKGLETLRAQESKERTDLLAGLFKEANEGRVKCAEIVAGNAEVVRECKATIAECSRCMVRTNEHLNLLEKNL